MSIWYKHIISHTKPWSLILKLTAFGRWVISHWILVLQQAKWSWYVVNPGCRLAGFESMGNRDHINTCMCMCGGADPYKKRSCQTDTYSPNSVYRIYLQNGRFCPNRLVKWSSEQPHTTENLPYFIVKTLSREKWKLQRRLDSSSSMYQHLFVVNRAPHACTHSRPSDRHLLPCCDWGV